MTAKRPIKIVFFATRLRRTGPMRQMLSMARASVAEGFDVHVVTLFDELSGDSIRDEYLKAFLLSAWKSRKSRAFFGARLSQGVPSPALSLMLSTVLGCLFTLLP